MVGPRFSLRHRVHTGSGAYHTSCRMGNGLLSLRVRRPLPDVDHSPLSGAECKEIVNVCFRSKANLQSDVLPIITPSPVSYPDNLVASQRRFIMLGHHFMWQLSPATSYTSMLVYHTNTVYSPHTQSTHPTHSPLNPHAVH